MSRKTLVVPLVIICAGIGFLLNYAGYYTHIHWPIVLGLAGLGAGVLLSGFNKITFVVSISAFAAAGLLYMFDTEMIDRTPAIIVLVVVFGGLLLASRVLPQPAWNQPQHDKKPTGPDAKRI
jgi:hypothetical protein